MKVLMSLRFLFLTARKFAPRPNFTFNASTLHLSQQTSPDLPYLRNVEKTFPWSNIFVKFSSCEKPPANTCSPLFLCLRLFHFITTNSDALPIYNIHLISSTWICYFFIYSSFFMLRYIFTFQHLKTYRYHIFSDLQPANILHKLVLQLLLENLYWAFFVDFQIIAISRTLKRKVGSSNKF